MNVDHSYVEVPTTTQEVKANEDHNYHPVESLETDALAGPEVPAAPKLSAPTVVGPSRLLSAQNLTSW